jgi:hypothetical protein
MIDKVGLLAIREGWSRLAPSLAESIFPREKNLDGMTAPDGRGSERSFVSVFLTSSFCGARLT